MTSDDDPDLDDLDDGDIGRESDIWQRLAGDYANSLREDDDLILSQVRSRDPTVREQAREQIYLAVVDEAREQAALRERMASLLDGIAEAFEAEDWSELPAALNATAGAAGRQVYVVMHCDRHADPTPVVYADRGRAIAYARELCERFASTLDDVVKVGTSEEFLYRASYSTDDDEVWVVALDVQ